MTTTTADLMIGANQLRALQRESACTDEALIAKDVQLLLKRIWAEINNAKTHPNYRSVSVEWYVHWYIQPELKWPFGLDRFWKKSHKVTFDREDYLNRGDFKQILDDFHKRGYRTQVYTSQVYPNKIEITVSW